MEAAAEGGGEGAASMALTTLEQQRTQQANGANMHQTDSKRMEGASKHRKLNEQQRQEKQMHDALKAALTPLAQPAHHPPPTTHTQLKALTTHRPGE